MDAVIKVPAGEFTKELFEKIKSLIDDENDLEITISVTNISKGILRNETKEEHIERLLKAKNNLDNNRNLKAFTAEEFEDFKNLILNEP